MSRHPQTVTTHKLEKTTEQYVNMIAQSAVPIAMTLKEVKQETQEDPTLRKLIQVLTTNSWHLVKSANQFPENVNVADL